MRNITGSLAALVNKKLGTRPSLVADFYWLSTGFETFGTKDYVDRVGNIIIPGKILSISNLDSQITLQKSLSNSVSIVLDDTDGKIKQKLNTTDIHKVSVVIRHVYDELQPTTAANTLVIFFGQITSPIIWDEGSRTVSFDVVSKIEDREVGFTPEQGQFRYLTDDSYGKTWPLCFGRVRKVPSVRLSAKVIGTSLTRYSIVSVSEYEEYVEKYTKYLDVKETQDNFGNDITDEEAKKVLSDVFAAKNDAFDIRRKLLKYHSTTPALLNSVDEYIDLIRFEENNLTDYYLQRSKLTNEKLELEKKNNLDPDGKGIVGDPDGRTAREERIDTIDNMLDDVRQDIDTTTASLNDLRSELAALRRQITGFALTSIHVHNGRKFPQNRRLTLEINLKKFTGTFNGDVFTILDSDVSSDSQFTIVSDNGYGEITISSEKNLKGKFCLVRFNHVGTNHHAVIYIVDQLEDSYVYRPQLFVHTTEWDAINLTGATVVETSPYVLGRWIEDFIDPTASEMETGLSKDAKDGDWTLEYGDEIVLDYWNYDVHVFNCVPEDYTPCTEVLGVYAYRTYKGARKLVPVPKSYYIKVLDEDIGDMRVAYLKLPRKLSAYIGEGWEDTIYVSFQSGLSNNTSDIIKFLIQNYSTISPDNYSFVSVATALTNYPSNFALLQRRNVLELIQEIAWQARCAVWVVQDVARIKYLSVTSVSAATLTAADIEMKSLQIAHGQTEDIITKMICRFVTDYSQERPYELILRNNITKYGEQKREFDFYIYDRIDLVEKSASFWLLRYSHTFKRARFKTFFTRLALETHDSITVNLSHIATNPVLCELESIIFDPTDQSLTFEIWTPVQSGHMIAYPLAYSGSAIGVTYPTSYDPYPGGSSAGFNVTEGFEFEYSTRPNDYGRGTPYDGGDTPPDDFNESGEIDYSPEGSPLRVDPKRIRREALDLAKTDIIDSSTGYQAPIKAFFELKKGYRNRPESEYPTTNPSSPDYDARVQDKTNLLVINTNHSALGSEDIVNGTPAPYGSMEAAFDTHGGHFNPVVNFFLAEITYYEHESSNKWLYSWKEVVLGDLINYNEDYPANPRRGGYGNPPPYDTHKALNFCEIKNSLTGTQGNSVNIDEIGNMRLQPVGGYKEGEFGQSGGECANKVIVVMFIMRTAEGKMYHAFQYENAIDGPC